MLVVGGLNVNGDNVATTEAVDVIFNLSCEEGPDFPYPVRFAVGGLVSTQTATDIPIVCGGSVGVDDERVSASSRRNFSCTCVDCYTYDGSSWVSVPSMSTPREQHTATSFPDGTMLVTGGQDDTQEVWSKQIII